ncbi:MAG: hypothetical protein ABJK25_18945 [Halieaceae bacterium]
MSAEGLLEVAFVTWGNVATLLALLITIISGYMVVAYTAGASLTRQQVILINLIYLLMGGFVGWGCREMTIRAALFEDVAYKMATGEIGAMASRGEVAFGIISAFSLAMIASLKFMWDIRHPKVE